MDGLTKHFRDAPPMAKAKKFDQWEVKLLGFVFCEAFSEIAPEHPWTGMHTVP